jgi:hypothetical protein
MTDFAYDPSAPLDVPFADVPALEGRRFEGPWFTVDDDDRELFERATWLDRVYPEPPPPEFGDDVVEGFMTLGLLDALWNQVIRFDRATTYSMNYGIDRVRFVAPVRTGQRLRLELEVAEVRPKLGGYVVRMHCVVAADGEERPGMVADWLVIVRPRGGEQT